MWCLFVDETIDRQSSLTNEQFETEERRLRLTDSIGCEYGKRMGY